MKFRIAGLSSHFDIIKKNLLGFKFLQYKGIDFIFYDSFGNTKFNGGRFLEYKINQEHIDFCLKHNFGISATFSNYYIDLSEQQGLKSLEILNEIHASIVISNLELLNFIKQHYPNIKTTQSVISKIELDTDLKCYYQDDPRIYDNINKTEILLDNRCYGCPEFYNHFDIISKNISNKDFFKSKYNGCYLKERLNIFNEDYKTSIPRFIKQGFKNFKIPGREYNKLVYENNLKELFNVLQAITR